MHRRQLLIAGGACSRLSACASNGLDLGGAVARQPVGRPRIGRAVLPRKRRGRSCCSRGGPVRGVPPWDSVTAAKLRAAIWRAVETCSAAEIQAIADNPAPRLSPHHGPLFDGRRALDGRTPCSGDDPEHRSRRLPGRRHRAVAAAVSPPHEITFKWKLFARIKTVCGQRRRSGLTAEQTRVAGPHARRLHAQRRRAGRRRQASWAGSQPPCRTPSPASAKGRRRREQPSSTSPRRPGWPACGVHQALRRRRRRAQPQRLRLCDRQHRSSVDPSCRSRRPRPARAVSQIRQPRRQRRRQRHQCDHRLDREAAGRAGPAARFANHADGGCRTRCQDSGRGHGLMNRVWAPARRASLGGRADMRAIAGHDIEPGDYPVLAEKVSEAEVRPRSERAEAYSS